MTQVTKNGVSQVNCVYDGNGMRVKKVENGKTVYYVYSGANPLMEYSPNDGSYLYRIYAGKKAVAEEKSGVVKFYHKDHLGSTRVVTNAAGVKIAEYKFAPYGEKEVSSGDGTEYGFTDKAEDASTGLKYFGARFYDPEVGRFLTVDPVKDGLNWYIYCLDNPLSFKDPDGLTTIYITVSREVQSKNSTIGSFVASNLSNNNVVKGVTLELPDRDNQRSTSRINAGTYNATRDTKKSGMKQEVVRLEDKNGRADVLIHVGNTPEDTKGCVLVGTSVAGPDQISGSASKMNELITYIDNIIATDKANNENTSIFVTISNETSNGTLFGDTALSVLEDITSDDSGWDSEENDTDY